MSTNGKPPKGPKGPKGRDKFRVVPNARTVSSSAKPSPATIKQLYMKSSSIEWSTFAKSMGWNSLDSRHGMPVSDWIEEKRNIIAREEAEKIAEAVFQHKSRWHSDVLKTLKEYPEANDAMLGILKKRLNDIIGTINIDNQRGALAKQTGENYQPEFEKIKTNDLMSLAAAIKICTESKHKALMINDWSFKVAESYSDPKQFGTTEQKIANMEWKVTVMGGENLTSAQMQKFLGDYYDKPMLPHTADEVEAKVVATEDEG